MALSRGATTQGAAEPGQSLRLREPPARPRTVVLVAVGWLALSWAVVVASDGLDLFGWQAHLAEPWWQALFFNRRPTEWLQWTSLAAAYGGALYLAARIRPLGDDRLSRFLIWFGVGAGLMLIEDAGDVRHIIALYVRRALDDSLVLGLHPATLVDVPYFAALAFPLLYALARYGRRVWQAREARPYVALAYAAYGLAAVGSALSGVGGGRHEQSVYLGSLYERMGGALVRALPGDQWATGGLEPAHFRFQIIDALVEESLELIGAACMLAVVVALARSFTGAGSQPSSGTSPS